MKEYELLHPDMSQVRTTGRTRLAFVNRVQSSAAHHIEIRKKHRNNMYWSNRNSPRLSEKFSFKNQKPQKKSTIPLIFGLHNVIQPFGLYFLPSRW